MKKTIVKQDGTQEVLEGTPEEISELEKRSRGDVKEEMKKPGLLTEHELRFKQELLQQVDRLQQQPLQQQPLQPLYPLWQHAPTCEIKTAERGGWLCVIPPRCTCGLFRYPNWPPTFTFTGTTWFTCEKCGNMLMGCTCPCQGGIVPDVKITWSLPALQGIRCG